MIYYFTAEQKLSVYTISVRCRGQATVGDEGWRWQAKKYMVAEEITRKRFILDKARWRFITGTKLITWNT